MKEKDFQLAVVDVARRYGWRVHHTRTIQIAGGGWMSPCLDKGFPDLLMVHPSGRIVAAELKSDTGRPTPEQQSWLKDLYSAGVETFIWRPSNITQVIEVLSKTK